MTAYTVDFETFSDSDLRKEGVHKYARHPSTVPLCMAYKRDDGPAKVWFPGDADPVELLEHVAAGGEFHAHNVGFELQIWNQICVKRYGWPVLKIEQCRCSMARAAMCGLPQSLGALGKALKTSFQKDDEGRRLMLKMCRRKKNGERYGTPADLIQLGEYCKTDVDTEHDCEKLLPELPPSEQTLWRLTMEINERGLGCDRALVLKAAQLLKENDAVLNARISELTGGAVERASQVKRLVGVLFDEGVDIESLDKFAVSEALKQEGLSPTGSEMLLIRQEVGKSSVKKYVAMLAACCADHRIRGTQRYHGASTGRWTAQGIQPHNFPRGVIKNTEPILDAIRLGDLDLINTVWGSATDALSSALRNMLVAQKGRLFRSGDFSAIEARVLCWLAGDDETVEAFRNNAPLYEQMAAMIFEKPVESITADSEERQLGKKVVLGAGFGIGHVKFRTTCIREGLNVSAELAERAVKTYRNAHKPVVSFWYALEAAALQAVREPGKVAECEKGIAFLVRGNFLLMRLPSGRKLWYMYPQIRMEKTKVGMKPVLYHLGQKNGQPILENTYGGKLAENCTQATARDIMADAMVRLERKGYPIVLTVHDEILSEDRVDVGHSLDEFKATMEIVPAWAAGLPLKVGCWEGPRYKKG